ncbi:hypothetical protein [Marinobacterium lutimaris]|uniref:Uncharacterized protein n=1 Tax=Marinobacterium lutimaris TaxID=568106 RepID=A0A1H5YCP5_9GAMM|nr:hypothetical protein [Marinobacterium lutimaris]SEG21505.1 hypothetical protein SAMN05444390_1011697 [Marinobacterium lutimaris]
MKFSMNGFRRQLSGDVEKLREYVVDAINGEVTDQEDFADAINDVICKVNGLNCVFVKDDPDFTDMGDIEIDVVDFDGEIAR